MRQFSIAVFIVLLSTVSTHAQQTVSQTARQAGYPTIIGGAVEGKDTTAIPDSSQLIAYNPGKRFKKTNGPIIGIRIVLLMGNGRVHYVPYDSNDYLDPIPTAEAHALIRSGIKVDIAVPGDDEHTTYEAGPLKLNRV